MHSFSFYSNAVSSTDKLLKSKWWATKKKFWEENCCLSRREWALSLKKIMTSFFLLDLLEQQFYAWEAKNTRCVTWTAIWSCSKANIHGKNGSSNNAADNFFSLFLVDDDDGVFYLKQNCYYMHVQYQLNVCKKGKCFFVDFTFTDYWNGCILSKL